MKIKYGTAILLLGMAISFFLGRSTVKTKETVKFVKGETIVAEYPTHLLLPSREIKANITALPTWFVLRETVIVDSIEYIVEKVDTTAIIEDFITQREYNLTLFDDNKQGRFDLHTAVQLNRLGSLSYSYTPISEEITMVSKPIWTPFISTGINTLNIGSVGCGLFYHNIGLEYSYLYKWDTAHTGHELRLKYKF